MNTLHTFGCSLTASTDWPNNLANDMKCYFHNHALPAGDNITQVRRFKDCVLQDKIKKEDFVVWEVTYLNRLGFRLSPDHHFFTNNRDNKKVNHNFHTDLENIVDGTHHVDYVGFNEEWYDTNWYVKNINDMLSELLYAFKIANERTMGKCLVWFAENNIFENDLTKRNFLNFLDTNSISFVDYDSFGLMSWVKDNNFDLAPDGMHPSQEVYNRFANTILKPRINKL